MSIRELTRVWDQSPAAGGALLVLLALADSADDAGYAWLTTERIAQRARLSERQAQRILDTLEADGQIARAASPGRGHTPLYAILCGLDPKVAEERVTKLPLFYTERVTKLHLLREKKAEKVTSAPIKGDMPIADLAVPMPDPSLSHHDSHGGGGGIARAKQILSDSGFSGTAIAEFSDIPPDILEAEIFRRRQLGQGPGAMVKAWRAHRPTALPPEDQPDARRSATVHAQQLGPPVQPAPPPLSRPIPPGVRRYGSPAPDPDRRE